MIMFVARLALSVGVMVALWHNAKTTYIEALNKSYIDGFYDGKKFGEWDSQSYCEAMKRARQ